MENLSDLGLDSTDLGNQQSVVDPAVDLFNEQFANFFCRNIRFTTFDEGWEDTFFASAVKKVADRFQAIRLLEPSSWQEARNFLLADGKASKASGWPYCTSKEKAFEEHENAIMYRAKQLMRGKVAPDLALAGCRTKGGKARLIFMCGIHDALLTARLYKPISEAIKEIESPWVTGIDGCPLKGRVISLVNASKSVLALDWSKFDSTVPRLVIEAAFKIVESWFVPSEETSKVFNAARRCFCNSNIIMPDYRVYFNRSRGIPSGSLFTSLVGSLSNLILIEFLVEYVNQSYLPTEMHDEPIKITDLMVYGDDSVVGLNVDPDTARTVLSTWTMLSRECFGMKLSLEKSYVSSNKTHFLGHWYSGVHKWRPLKETLQQLVFPERFAAWQEILTVQGDCAFNSWREFEIYRILGLIADNGDPKTRSILLAYLSYLESRVVSEVDLIHETLREVSYYDAERFDYFRCLRPGVKSFVVRLLNT
jgi:hypothetical protein